MSTRTENIFRQSKQASSFISKFNYHYENTVPSLCASKNIPDSLQQSPKIISKKNVRNMNFHFAEQVVEGVGIISAEAILLSALKVYVGPDCVKLSETSFKKTHSVKGSFLPIYGQFNEIIEFCLIDNSEERPQNIHSRWVKPKKQTEGKGRQTEQESVLKPNTKKIYSNNYELFVIHHCQNKDEKHQNTKWQNFVEKFHFKESPEDNETASTIHYSCIFSYEVQEGILNYCCSYKQKFCQTFIKEHLVVKDGELVNINVFLGHLLQNKDRVGSKLQELNDPAFDQSQKKWLKLSPESFKMFTYLRKHTVRDYKHLYGEVDRFDDNILSNLTYRYMVAKQFNSKEIIAGISEYLKWQKHLSENYDLTMFERFHNLDFYTFLGYDHDGRCVILNKAANLFVDQIDSVDDYCHYMMYFIQVYIPRKLRGYASEYIVLGDVQNLGKENFKLAITKRNIFQGTTYCPERQFKFVAFNTGPWASSLWKVFKFLLPKRTLGKVNLLSQNREEILNALLELMDISVIPEYLGGTNKRTYKDDLSDECEYLSQRKQA